MARDIVGKKVRHKTLGVGTVISQDRRYIKVMYENGEKEHNYATEKRPKTPSKQSMRHLTSSLPFALNADEPSPLPAFLAFTV